MEKGGVSCILFWLVFCLSGYCGVEVGSGVLVKGQNLLSMMKVISWPSLILMHKNLVS